MRPANNEQRGGLLERQPGTFFIVISSLVLQALGGTRPDVVAPDTGRMLFSENGHIVAVRGFVC